MAYPDPHPVYGEPLGGNPYHIEGVTFRPYKRGTGSYARVSDDFRIMVYSPHPTLTYRAVVDGVEIPTRFRSQQTAFRAALRHLRAKL